MIAMIHISLDMQNICFGGARHPRKPRINDLFTWELFGINFKQTCNDVHIVYKSSTAGVAKECRASELDRQERQ